MKLTIFLLFCMLIGLICISASAEPHPAGAHHHAVAAAAAAGDNKDEKKHSAHKSQKKFSAKSTHDEEKAKKGEVLKELHKKDNEEKGGKKTEHHSEAQHKSHKKAGGGSEDGIKFQEGAKHKKANFKKGFRELYHKDEEKKHDSFYSTSKKGGEFKVFGQKNNKHQSNSYSKKQKKTHKGVKSAEDHGKAGKKIGGHHVDEKKGHQEQKQMKSRFDRQDKWGKKASRKGGKQYKYKIPSNHK